MERRNASPARGHRESEEGKAMQITKKQVIRVEDAKRQHVQLLNKELAYSADLQKGWYIAELRANIAKLDKMIENAK